MKCPYGSFLDPSALPTMVVIEDACKYCPPGMYSGLTQCEICPAGFVCLGHTINKYPIDRNVDKGYECPPGYFCPEGSYIETACPVGTYRSNKKGQSIDDCIPCPENTFNDRKGQASCRKCGASASAPANSTTCICQGKFREFFKSDSSCRCISGYYQVKYGIQNSQDDSLLDCEPHVYATCSGDEIYNQEGICVKKDNCNAHCNGGSGTYSANRGVCVCNNLPSVDESCDQTCRSEALQAVINSGRITITNPKNPSQTINTNLKTSPSIYTDYYDANDATLSTIKSIGNLNGYFKGRYGTTDSFKKQFNTVHNRRVLQATQDSIDSPMMCVTPQETVAFDVSPDHYPVYLKNSLVNTVINFDYGAFVSLADTLTKSVNSVDTFLYRFSTIGTYIFGDSTILDSQLVIVVSATCDSLYVIPMTEANLAKYGVGMRDDIIHKFPLWAYMICVLLLFAAFGGTYVTVRVLKEEFITWTYGKDGSNVLDGKKVDEPSEIGDDEMENLIRNNDEDVDGLFFVYFKQKLNEMDDKMKELLARANINSLKKLKKLSEKINNLREIFNEHVGSLTMPNGLTIDEYLKANADKLDQDSSYYSSIIDPSEDRSDGEAPQNEEKKESAQLPQETAEVELQPEPEIKDELEVEDEQAIAEDTKKLLSKVNENKEKDKEEVANVLQTCKDDFMKMVIKHGTSGNANEVQNIMKSESERLHDLQGKLMDELEAQNAELDSKLMHRQEKKLKAKVELVKIKKQEEEAEAEKKKKLNELDEEKEKQLAIIRKDLESDKVNGQRLIQTHLNEQLAEHQSKFVKKFAESEEKEKLLARHEGETQRLKEYLDSEKRRQETELDVKLKQRLVDRHKVIEKEFKTKKDALEKNYQNIIDENEAKRAVIEGQVPIIEGELMEFAEELKNEQEKILRQRQKAVENEAMMIDAKRQGDDEAMDKEGQLEEKKVQLDSKKDLEELAKKKVIKESELKEKFTKDLKNAPTSKEKSDLLNQYESAKNALEKNFEDERKKTEQMMEIKLAERRREKEKKKIQQEFEAQQQKLDASKKATEDLSAEIDKVSSDAVLKLLDQALRKRNPTGNEDNKQNTADVPIIFEYLVSSKTSQSLNSLKKAQFAELSQQVSAMYTQLMKEKFLDVFATKEASKKKVEDLERKALPANKYQPKLERIQKEEVQCMEAINVNYENRSVTQESRIRIALAEQHYNEHLKLIDREEENRKRLLDKMLRKYNEEGIIPKSVIDELDKKKAEEFNEMREEAKRDRDKRVAEAQKLLGEMNQEDLKEVESRYAREIDEASKQLDNKLKTQKKNAIEERKKQYEERLSKIPAISIDQRKLLMEEHMKDVERMENSMNAAREDQLKKLREKLVNKKIQQERIRSRTEQNAMKKIKEINNDQVVIVEGQREQMEAAKAKVKAEQKVNPYNYMMLLKQWAQNTQVVSAPPKTPPVEVPEGNVVEEETKEEAPINDADGAFVNMKELFETVLSCYDLALNVQDFEFPEIAKAIEKLTYFMEAILKGGKKLADANVGRLGPKPT